MKKIIKKERVSLVLCFAFLFVLSYSCQKAIDKNASVEEFSGIAKPPQLTKNFQQVNLVSSSDEYPALLKDPTLVNPWGLAFNGTGAVAWPASQETGLSQLYTYNPAVPSVTRLRAVGI